MVGCIYLPASVVLLHFWVDVKAWVTHLSNFLSKQFDSFSILTENNSLINVKLREKSVQTMYLFFFFQVCIKLSNSFQGELIHKVNEFRVRNVLLLESLNCHWVGSRKERDLLIFRHYIDNFGNNHFEVIWEQFVHLIKNQHFAIFELGNVFGS